MKNTASLIALVALLTVGCNSETEEQRIRREESEAMFKKVAAIVAKQVGVEESAITRKTTFEDIGTSPEDIAAIIQTVQKEFDVVIPNLAQDPGLVGGGIGLIEINYKSTKILGLVNVVVSRDLFGDDFGERIGRPAKEDREQLP